MEKLLTPEQVAEILTVTPNTIREWLKKGELKGLKIKNLWRIRQSELEAFIKAGEKYYVRHYCEILSDALGYGDDGEVVIDMDVVADAVGKEGEKPAFYVSDESQQCKFTCKACGEFNDILGRFGYCSQCGTRNDLADFEEQTVPSIRERLNSGNAPEDCVRDAVASFDSFMAQVAKQLVELVPMTKHRKNRLLRQRFHDLKEVRATFKEWFDIDVCESMKEHEYESVVRMFHRRQRV